jgi:hypothetical protein
MVFALVCASSGCSPNSGAGAAGPWVAQGAGACEKFLSPEVVATLFTQPGGVIRTTSPHACSFTTADGGSLTITLSSAGPADFEEYQKYLGDPQPLPGVGDRASQSVLGVVAVQGADRHCSIDARGATGSLKLRGAELGRALGRICNRVFALP